MRARRPPTRVVLDRDNLGGGEALQIGGHELRTEMSTTDVLMNRGLGKHEEDPMTVSYERTGKIAVLTIEGRTDMNLFAPDTVYLPLYDAFMQYEEDEEAWCAVLTGAGDKAFSAGGDLKAYEKLDTGYGREVGGMLLRKSPQRSLHTLIRGDLKISKPMIFAVNGLCLGAATVFTMCYSDVTFAVPHARFGLPEIKWAIAPGTSASRLQRFLPWPIAMELYLTGRLMEAEEAFRHGFVNHVVPPDRLMSAATAKAQEIADMPPLHIRKVKEVMLADRAVGLAASQRIELLAGGIPYDHPDTREGILAFVEHRTPQYTGERQGGPKAAGVLE